MRATVSSELRSVTVVPHQAVLGVEHDANMRTVEWTVPRQFDGVDMGGFRLQVHYINADGEGGCSEARDVQVGELRLSFTWRVPAHALAKAGNVEAAFVARDMDGLQIRSEYKSAPASFSVLKRMAEQDPRGDQLVDVDGNIVVVRMVD